MTIRSKITLRNDFHNTEATIISLDGFILSLIHILSSGESRE